MKVAYRNILMLAGGIIMMLTVVTGCLFQENRKYKTENRKLIIQNDSIISVNIELKNFLQKKNLPVKSTSMSLKKETGNE